MELDNKASNLCSMFVASLIKRSDEHETTFKGKVAHIVLSQLIMQQSEKLIAEQEVTHTPSMRENLVLSGP